MSRERSRKRKWVRVGLALLALTVLWLGAPLVIGAFNLFHAHEHCMKIAGISLTTYASENDGRFPHHTNGFGDALVVLIKASGDPAKFFTAPGDAGQMLLSCLESGADVPESKCTRAYVQGLAETNNPQIALLFDRYPTRGGDHFRRPWGPKQREVWMLGGGMEIISEARWPEFMDRQIKLLVAEGLSQGEAEAYYQPCER